MTEEELKNQAEEIKPEYVFLEEETEKDKSPIDRVVVKSMKLFEKFTVKNVYEYLGGLNAEIARKQEDLKSLETVKENMLKELAIVEQALGVNSLEEEYKKAKAAELEKISQEQFSKEVLDTPETE